ncbi:hypothetical protein BO70DRAFT_377504 [Aspergillus heteromorphus CBS 117.55]|uniref:Uncharacterized protein n=1 Tax=Aspergillus heteromorphus CBS 117.55 TaxID=1448321 RepID=A0A317WXX6_9EURO|nr:uncharacterized protein BO70DRAFT_377504 [Aspergillus heteromorphus CBS 117.55]PWY89050.1 hypothetical protein BO70DRAFT_377504 [Aspergillus heteromorphus CBS 117.55]
MKAKGIGDPASSIRKDTQGKAPQEGTRKSERLKLKGLESQANSTQTISRVETLGQTKPSEQSDSDNKDNLINTLTFQVDNLERELLSYEDDWDKRGFQQGSSLTTALCPSLWPMEVGGMWKGCHNFVSHYGYDGVTDFDRLSKEQKQRILARLDGYYTEGLEWDELVTRLPSEARSSIEIWAAERMLYKDLIRRFWINPFWFLEDHQDGQDGPISTSLGTQLHGLHQDFMKVDHAEACLWRRTTVRLANIDKRPPRKHPEFGQKTHDRWLVMAQKLASNTLADEDFQSLLKPLSPEDTDKNAERRSLWFTQMYEEAAELSIDIAFDAHYVEFHDLRSLDSLEFRHKSNSLRLDRAHGATEKISEELDGHKILLMSSAVLYRDGGGS